MNLVLIGLNHKSAPVEVREGLAISHGKLREATERLLAGEGVREAMVLSTCNRVELVGDCVNPEALYEFVQSYCGRDAHEIGAHVYEYRGREAVRHLFEVACSLDSMIVGEPQVLGQVREAYAAAREAGALYGELELVVERALAAAKRVRRETAIGSSAVSVASAAVALAKEIFGSLEGKQVFLVGAGKMSELAARHLLSQGAGAIFVANRTYERAVTLAERFGGSVIRFDQLYELADRADIVISSTGAPHAIFRKEHGERFLQRRRNRPMFFIDIAVPRDVAPEMSQLDGIFVYNIDDLQSVVAGNVNARTLEAERARQIIAEEVERCMARLESRQVAPTITSLQEHLENIRRAELERVRGKLGRLTPEQEETIEALTRGIVNKVLHAPATALKSAAREAQASAVIEAVQKIFKLPAEPAAKPGTEEPAAAEAPAEQGAGANPSRR